MKKKDFLVSLKDLSVVDLKNKVLELSDELLKLRFKQAVSQLDKTHQFSEVRKKIAQVNTVISQKNNAEKDLSKSLSKAA